MITFSQRDPHWSTKKLGTGVATIGKVGCLMTSVAGVLATNGIATDPDQLNQWLIAKHGYADGNLFIFNSV